MDKAVQRTKAEAFRAMHYGPEVLLLGSVWDVASAVVFERAGFAALGTSSAGIAYMLGHPDSEGMPRDAMLAVVAQIAARVSIPVSADMLAGFGRTAEAVADTCRAVLDAGAIGVNLEDGTEDPAAPLFELALQCEKIRAVRSMADAYGVPLVINARTDGYWLKLWDGPRRIAESIRRATAYREAGADCLFIPGAIAADDIATFVREIGGPLNILTVPGCPSVGELARLGVARVSQGSGPARAALATARRVAEELRAHGTYTSFHQGAVPYPEANALFASAPHPVPGT